MKNSIIYILLTFTLLALAALTSSYMSSNGYHTQNSTQTMNDYSEQWKEIKELEKKGLIKSAHDKVVLLYDRAKREKNDPQIIKTVLFRERYGSQLEEYGFENSVRTFQKEASTLEGPAKSIMHFMIGKSLSNYVQANQWKFSNRTTTPSFQTEDLETWSIQHFNDEIDQQFALALEDESLKKTRISDYDAITKQGVNTDQLRPTIYDVIAHQILQYYTNPNRYLTEPVYKFYLDAEEAFAPATDFVKHEFVSQDSSSRLLRATLIFQDVIQHLIKRGDDAALVDADLKRLSFVLNNATIGQKGQKYIATLDQMANKYAANKVAMPMILMAQASFYSSSQTYLNQEKNDLKKAYEIFEIIVKKYPSSIEANLAKNGMANIGTTSINMNIEKVYPSGEDMLSLVSYKNLDEIHLRVYRLEPGQEYELQNRSRDLLKAITKLDLVKSWTQELPKYADYHQHTTEIKIDQLPLGSYVILTSSDKAFGSEKSHITSNFITISNLSYVLNPNHSDYKMIVVDRRSGQPVAGAEVSFYSQEYNRKLRINELKLATTAKSDKDGIVNPKLNDRGSYFPKVVYKDDVLFARDRIYQHRQGEPRDRSRVNVFLDRAIYRPGQTIYFKAIAHQVDGETQLPSLLTNQSLEVVLRDANYQEVEKLNLTTNDFGSIHGSFTAPSGGLLGNMTIQIAGYGGTSFSVEEYKRPKFEAEFLPVETTYALNESVTISGKAIGFAGNAIGDAKVAYRVERGVEYPYWRSYRRWYRPQSPMRIKTGTAVSKADGTFDIDFELLPDPSSKQKDQPVFVYTIYADITDISGETRSVQTRLRASSIALDLGLSTPSPIERDSFKTVNVFTRNLNGKFQETKVNLQIASLKSEDKLYRDRYWAFPDTVSFGQSDFENYFPHYRFSKKKSAIELEVEKVLYTEDIVSTKNGEIDLSVLDLEAGMYKIIATANDKNGNEILKEIAFEVTDAEATQPAIPLALATQQDKNTYEPGDKVQLTLSSSIKDAYIFFVTTRRDMSNKHQWLKFYGKQKESITVNESDRGNISLSSFTIYNNRFYSKVESINVPWSNKDLKISYTSFRDKLLPGQDEEWTIKVEGDKKEKVAAELLAGMYDASLDQFRANNWNANYFPNHYANHAFRAGVSFVGDRGRQISYPNTKHYDVEQKIYRQFDWLGFNAFGYGGFPTRNVSEMASTSAGAMKNRMQKRMKSAPAPSAQMDEISISGSRIEATEYAIDGVAVSEDLAIDSDISVEPERGSSDAGQADKAPAIRKNLNETVFFYPNLKTDKDGNVLIMFKMNEALTKWKFMAFAHTKDLATAISTKEIVTQKELMVQPNAPRFFREGDKIRYSAKVSNLTENAMTGTAKLELYDAITNESLDKVYGNTKVNRKFTINPGESAPLFWELNIPKDKLGTVLHRVVAESGQYADGEENAVPVLTNRKLVTETMPMPLRAGQSKEFVFQTMRDNTSNTLTNHAFTLEFTSNPAWYAVQSLPYLMEYPYQCTEQVFNRYYANALAAHITNSTPKIKQIFESWKGTDAMKSNLSKNQELKSALLEETPWVLDAQSEEQQKRNIALLFDLNKMSQEKASDLKTLVDRQLSNGGFAWFPGGRDSWYITQYVVESMGHLQRLGVDLGDQDLTKVVNSAVRYIDDRLVEHYEQALKYNKDPNLSGMVIHYLYARSFFTDISMKSRVSKIVKHYQGKVKEEWIKQGLYYQGMLALASDRFDMKTEANAIVASLKERALSHEELGMYWKYDRGYYWYQMPIETHALMIEVFEQVAKDKDMVDELRLWLLKNKQTNAWETTKATSAAIYALLMSGDTWLQETKQVDIDFGDKKLNEEMVKSQAKAEAGTGYFKKNWTEVIPDLSTIKVNNPNTVPAWGAAYWQYFEDLDKITSFEETPLKLSKKVFKESQGDRGATMEPVSDGASLSVGDKLIVRIELRVDRDMEFIHMKDMRASGFEPMNVFSQYKWQGGLGYYESTKDASTNFFFDDLPKGTYVFEYPVRVVHQGDFSNGVTTIQSMYAPEFASHSKGVRIKVRE
jgi:uncharacterized protein YfaS (alpha-2-macroglobulin family)